MARPHHRKKHREHLKQFRNRETSGGSAAKSRAANILAIGGAIFGLAISYFATNGDWMWVSIATIVCVIAGYLVGRAIDRG